MTDPTRKERFRPLELIVLSAVIAVVVGAVVLVSTRDVGLGAIFFGIAFIVSLITFAMLALSMTADDTRRGDSDRLDPPAGH